MGDVETKAGYTGHEMDIRDLKFDSDSFDVAIDKGPSILL